MSNVCNHSGLIRRSGFKILMRQDSTHGKSDLSGGNESESCGD